jgi:uncharacterized protein (DUF1684 family)
MDGSIRRCGMNRSALMLFAICIAAISGCRQQKISEQGILDETLTDRRLKDSLFRSAPESPFRQDTSLHYHGLRWFDPDPEYYFRSKLYRFNKSKELVIFGTKGEERRAVRYGYFLLSYHGNLYALNVYKTSDRLPDGREPLSVWFTDETTGGETYGVGRYVDVDDEQNDPNFLYTINLNSAYNPYCAYSASYSCAVPNKEDHLPFPVRAGEKKYHP